MNPKILHIPKPCHEDWNKMTPTEKGAFCKVCQKEVNDLTNVPVDQIKNVLNTATSECIKVQDHKLDELNFFEWFDHLTLKKRLKYLFLFSLMFISAHRSVAQDTLVQPQYVEVDSSDRVDHDASIDLSDIEVEPKTEEELFWEGIGTIHWVPEPYEVTIISTLGATSYGWIISTPMEPVRECGDKPDIRVNMPIKLGKNVYAFYTADDSLHMSVNSFYDHDIVLTISNDLHGVKPYPSKNTVFTLPIKVRKGQHFHTIPISSFTNGMYTVRIEGAKASGVTRLMYW